MPVQFLAYLGESVAKILWLMLPAIGANMTASLVRDIPILNTPLDLGFTFRGKRITGDHKTYRGLVFGILAAITIVYLQQIIYPIIVGYSVIDYSQANTLLLGILLGGGALFGDALKSFFKRQCNILQGRLGFLSIRLIGFWGLSRSFRFMRNFSLLSL